jgi:hypothetical protein
VEVYALEEWAEDYEDYVLSEKQAESPEASVTVQEFEDDTPILIFTVLFSLLLLILISILVIRKRMKNRQ